VMGSSSGSRKELRATLDLAAAYGIRPRPRCFPLKAAADALAELESARPAGRPALVVDS
jgi:D-arabinose 1-dehydrogenase-like Zn-dependent alcohol dehydrogenase